MTKYSNESASNFVLSLNILVWKLYKWFRRPKLWATGDWQLHHNNGPDHALPLAKFSGKTSNHPGDSAPLQPRFCVLSLLAFPKTKITLEREKISDCWWDSGKYDGEKADGNWENCVRSQGAYFERDCDIIVLCTMLLVSCIFFNKCLYFSYYMSGYFWTDLMCFLNGEQPTDWGIFEEIPGQSPIKSSQHKLVSKRGMDWAGHPLSCWVWDQAKGQDRNMLGQQMCVFWH